MRPLTTLRVLPRLLPRLLPGLLLALLLWPSPPVRAQDAPTARPAAQDWFAKAGREFRSKHYRILSDLDPDETKLYAAHLDLMYEEYARRLAGIPQQAPEVPFVLMFQREADYLGVLRNRYGINGTGSGGMFFISPAGAALAFFVEQLPRTRVLHVVQHEGFHQYAHSRFAGTLPPWVNEGLAEFFGEAIVVDGRVIVGQASPGAVAAVKKAIETGTTVDFVRLITMSNDQWNANVRAGNASVQYVQAWSMVQFLGWADGGRYQRPFEGYLRLLHSGMPSERAFVQAFGTNDVASFERAWREWATNLTPSAFSAAAARISFLAEGLRYLSREGVAVSDLEDLVSQLRERNFSIEITVHGRTETIAATDAILDIPQDNLAKSKPVFDLIPPRRSTGTTSTDRKMEAKHPTPPVLTTRGLEPRELVLKWTRNKKTGGFEYELLSPKEAPAAPRRPARKPDAGNSPS
jgi:hypothetical protein